MFTIERGGYSWVVGNNYTDDAFGPSDHEAPLEPVFREMLGVDGVFLDVGAHVGHWAVLLAGQARKVIAVEANPATAGVLRANVAANGLGNVTVLEAAAWDCDQLLRMEDPHGKIRGASTRTIPDDEHGTVRGQPLDGLLAGEPEIRLVKLDVEGADIHALNGMRETLARCRPGMIVERHDFLGYYTADDLFGLLAELGYRWRDGPFWCGAPHLICEPA